MTDYSYQDKLVGEVYELIKTDPSGGAVLAATPGAGKTNMAIEIIKRFLRDNPTSKVLVFAHGQTVLREQFYERLERLEVKYSFAELTCAPVDAQIQVAIPHFFKMRKIPTDYGLIVVDEAHHFFFAKDTDKEDGMVQRFIKKNPRAKVLCLTGTPSPFIKAKNFPMRCVTACELLDYEVLKDPYIELVQTALPFTMDDYNGDEDLRQEVEMTDEQVRLALTDSFAKLCDLFVKRLKHPVKTPNWNKGVLGNAAKAFFERHLQKTLVICNRQSQAYAAKRVLKSFGIDALVSTSDSDKDSANVTQFKTGPEPVLIVVNRATLGFDYTELFNIVDISCTMNPDKNFQALCRLVRVSEKKPKEEKLFIKVTPTATAPLTHHVMSFVMAMGTRKVFEAYDGSWKHRAIPVAGDIERVVREQRGNGEKNERPKTPPKVNLPRFYTFQDLKHVDHGEFEPYAWSTFTETKRWMSEEFARVEETKEKILVFARKLRKEKEEAGKFEDYKATKSDFPEGLQESVRWYRWSKNASCNDFLKKLYTILPNWSKLSVEPGHWRNNRENCKEELQKHPTLKEAKALSPGAYVAACKYHEGLVNEVFPNRIRQRTQDEVYSILKKYRSVKDLLSSNDKAVYHIANRKYPDLIKELYFIPNAPLSEQEVDLVLQQKNIQRIGVYTDTTTAFKMRCPTGHEFENSFRNVNKRSRNNTTCPQCRGQTLSQSKSVKIYCHQNKTIYNSVKKASLALGIHRTSISQVLTGKNKTAGGYTFEYVKSDEGVQNAA